jgi:hypothetical protein
VTAPKRRGFGPLTAALWLLIALFIGGDVVASKTHYKYGETVSASIWQHEHFWLVRVLTFAFMTILGTYLGGHFALHWPL